MARSTVRAEPADHRLLTTIGLFMEAHAGLVATFERRLADHGAVTGQSFEILLRLVRSEDHRLRMSDLAAQTTLTASGLTRAVDRLGARWPRATRVLPRPIGACPTPCSRTWASAASAARCPSTSST